MFTSLALASAVAHPGHWGAGFGWLFFLIPLFWIGLLVLIIALVGRRWRRAAPYGPWGYGGHPPWAHAPPARSAESTLAERFAQGDIDEKEYRARLEVLRAGSPYPPAPEK